ncbi:MAG: NADH-quinone oxidoreductase subunit L [Chloroflexi bacterium]|nr:MAG: NADH-quinone oxidoreductase subunit L [Chloroflexota bacterium]
MDLFSLVPLVVFFPVIGLLINLIFGQRLGEKGIGIVASLFPALSFVVSVLLAVALAQNPEGRTVPFLEWINAGEVSIPWAFQVDTLSVTMMLVVSGVGTLIHIYATGYMHQDVRHHGDPKSYKRFFIYFNLFIAAMMILVSANNYLMLFVGWEGVGLCSYLLIGFWFDKGKDGIGNAWAGKKAFVVNRIGDFGFLIASFLLFWQFRSFEFSTVFEQAAQAPQSVLLAITLFMLLGVTGKSAQLPLFVWLPDAMAGPTPVSALIHAATMVTAGVYLVARSHPLYIQVEQAQEIVALTGALTALFAATIAIGQFDIKKVLAYSTISQLGFMVAAVGMGAFVAGMFHLVTHAFFKALLFLSAGSVIHGMEHGLEHVEHDQRLRRSLKGHGHDFDVQDMRNMGGLRDRMKTTFWVYLIGAVALAGIPPLAGFWSKDEILAEGLHLNIPVYILLTITALLTAFYAGRQVFMVFFGSPRTEPPAHAVESSPIMTIPLMVLAFLAFFGGLLNLPSLHTFTDWLMHTLMLEEAGAAEAVGEAAAAEAAFNPTVAIISTVLAVGGFALAWYIYRRVTERQKSIPPARRPDDPLRPALGPVFTGMEKKWWVDELYDAIIVRPYKWLSQFLADVIDWRFWHDWFHDTVIAGGYRRISQFLSEPVDMGVIDRFANRLADSIQSLAARGRLIQTGFVSSYALSVFIGVMLIIGYFMVRLTIAR